MIETAGNIIRQLLKATGRTQQSLADQMGYKGQSAVAERLNKDMRVSVFVRMLAALGYDVYVVKRQKGGRIAFSKDEALQLKAGDFE